MQGCKINENSNARSSDGIRRNFTSYSVVAVNNAGPLSTL